MKNTRKAFFLVVAFLLASSACKKNEPVPVADFTFQANNNFKIPCNVIFTNHSTDAFSYDWDFGDNTTSTETNPTHTYTKPGTYYILLKAYTSSRYQWASKSEPITIKDTVP